MHFGKKVLTSAQALTAATILLLSGCSLSPHSPFGSNLERSRQSRPNELKTFRGVFHIHSEFSHDSSGTLQDVIRTARRMKLDFAVVTDHNSLAAKRHYAKASKSTDPLLIIGSEISTTDGHLIALGLDEEILPPIEPQNAIDRIKALGGYSVIAHPICPKTEWKDWSVHGFDGIEIYNQACDVYASNKASFTVKSILLPPQYFVRSMIRNPQKSLARWDELSKERSLAAFGAVDAHEKAGFSGFSAVRYSLLFRAVTMYVLSSEKSEKTILNAMFSGRSFIAFESFGSARGFTFGAQSGGQKFEMGSTFHSELPVSWSVYVPRKSEIRIMRNGETILTGKNSTGFSFDANGPGIYRIEVYRHGHLWIVSNPITLQA